MLVVLIDLFERLINYFKPFSTAREKVQASEPSATPVPNPESTQLLRKDLLAGQWKEPFTHIDNTDQDARLADFISQAKKDPRNDGPRKLGNIYRMDRDTVVYPKLRFTTTVWQQIFLDFSKYYSIAWDET